MLILIDQDIKGDSSLLRETLIARGWPEVLPIRFVTFDEVGLPNHSDDRSVWRFAQANYMILLTANRNMKGENSLERTIREEGQPTSLPVVTISNRKRIRERNYRERCIERLVEIVIYTESYLGTSRIFIP